jgi:hypothetical protein
VSSLTTADHGPSKQAKFTGLLSVISVRLENGRFAPDGSLFASAGEKAVYGAFPPRQKRHSSRGRDWDRGRIEINYKTGCVVVCETKHLFTHHEPREAVSAREAISAIFVPKTSSSPLVAFGFVFKLWTITIVKTAW